MSPTKKDTVIHLILSNLNETWYYSLNSFYVYKCVQMLTVCLILLTISFVSLFQSIQKQLFFCRHQQQYKMFRLVRALTQQMFVNRRTESFAYFVALMYNLVCAIEQQAVIKYIFYTFYYTFFITNTFYLLRSYCSSYASTSETLP